MTLHIIGMFLATKVAINSRYKRTILPVYIQFVLNNVFVSLNSAAYVCLKEIKKKKRRVREMQKKYHRVYEFSLVGTDDLR